MDIRECYEQFGGDYDDVVNRLRKEERIIKYVKMFMAGDDYSLVEQAVMANNDADAFLNVHNLKGVALNLGLTPLYQRASVLCEALRPGNPTVDKMLQEQMLQDIKEAYDGIIEAFSKMSC